MELRVPLHISGFWAPVISKNPITSGSLGAGITLGPLVVMRIERSGRDQCRVLLNNRCINELGIIRTIDDVLRAKDRKYLLRINSCVDLGDGYGLSAVIAIGYSFMRLLELGLRPSINRIGIIAHYAEVVNMTGLADVIAEIRGGGLVVRIRPGPPGIGDIDVIPIKDEISLVTIKLGRKLTTPEMLKSMFNLFRVYGIKAYSTFMNEPSLEKFIECSYMFSRAVGFLSGKLDEVLRNRLGKYLRLGYVLGYFVKKSLLVVICARRFCDEVKEVVNDLGVRVRLLVPTSNGLVVVRGNG